MSVNINDKLTAADFNKIKTALAAELTRRGGEGSIWGYANTSDPVIKLPVNVNPDDINFGDAANRVFRWGNEDWNPALPPDVIVDVNLYNQLESKLMKMQSYRDDAAHLANTTNSEHGCASSCTGLCYSTCYGACLGTCGTGCYSTCGENNMTEPKARNGTWNNGTWDQSFGCASFVGCNNNCAGSCRGCGAGCAQYCGTSCAGCDGSCSGCKNQCGQACKGGCGGSCTGCIDTCTATCGNTCTGLAQ